MNALKRIFAFLFKIVACIGKGFWRLCARVCKWLKKSLKVFAVLACVLFVALVVATACIDYILAYAINHSAAYLETNASVGDVRVRLLTQTVSFDKISLRNPAGFIEKEAFFAEKLELKFDIFKTPALRRVSLKNPRIRMEGRHGKRIIGQSVHKSNYFTLVKDFVDLFSRDLDEAAVGQPKDLLEELATVEQDVIRMNGVAEINISNLHIENGEKDTIDIASIIFHNGIFSLQGFESVVCGVETALAEGSLDLNKEKMGFSGFRIKNPEGYPDDNAVSLNNFLLKYKRVSGAKDGPVVLKLEKVLIDTPIARVENKEGSLLGALGGDNNFLEISNRLSVFYGTQSGNLFHPEFEGVEEGEEFKLPEIALEHIQIKNAQLLCRTKDGAIVSNIIVDDDAVEMDGIYTYIGGLRAEIAKIRIDAKAQLLTVARFNIKNPLGYPEENAFHLGEMTLTTHTEEKHIRGTKVAVLERITLKDCFVRLDSKSGKLGDLFSRPNNLLDILDDVKAVQKEVGAYHPEAQQKRKAEPTARPIKFILKDFCASEIRVLIGPKGEEIKIPLDDFELKNLGEKEGGLTADELSHKIIGELSSRAIDKAVDELERDIWQAIVDFFKNIF